jgi:cytochrome c biogenesis protein CcmG, thiol:disulfide interchange protein DsbE
VSARAFAATLGVLAVIGLLGFGLIAKGSSEIAVGDPAPDAELPVLDGEGTGSLADYRGRWVLVNFWASWCDPCRTEAPALERFHEKHSGPGFTVLGIDQRDLTDDALEFVEEYELSYPQLRDGEGDRADPFGMTGLPESFLIDPAGNIALIRRGPVDRDYLDRYVAPLIDSQSAEKRGTAS